MSEPLHSADGQQVIEAVLWFAETQKQFPKEEKKHMKIEHIHQRVFKMAQACALLGIHSAEAVAAFRREYLIAVLTLHKGNQCKAAMAAGMHRNTLSHQLKELKIEIDDIPGVQRVRKTRHKKEPMSISLLAKQARA